MASPAEIANDMAQHAAFWSKRDRNVAELCQDTATLIRLMLGGQKPDGRTFGGVWRRLLDRERKHYESGIVGFPNFGRARSCLEKLKSDRPSV